MVTCFTCDGSGRCKKCGGKGIIYAGLLTKKEQPCKRCKGLGKCPICEGSGEISTVTGQAARVRCPKCRTTIIIESQVRPYQTKCNCGLKIVLDK